MKIRRVVPNIATGRLDESRRFYTEVFGFDVAMDMGWIVTLASPDNPTAQISLCRNPESAPAQPPMGSITVEVDDVDAIHAKAVARGVPIVYPLTDEPWCVRRFALTDPSGMVVNVMCHRS